MSAALPVLLLVSDDALLTRSVQTAAQRRCQVVVARNLNQARAALESSAGTRAIVVDGAAVAKNVQAELGKLRALAPLSPVLFIAPQVDAAVINMTQAERVQLVVRPLPSNALALFIERAVSAGRLASQAVAGWVEQVAVDHRLSPADLALLPLVLGHEELEATCARLGIDRAQVARGLRRLVKKCRVRNIDRLGRNILRDAYLFSSALTTDLIEHASASSF